MAEANDLGPMGLGLDMIGDIMTFCSQFAVDFVLRG